MPFSISVHHPGDGRSLYVNAFGAGAVVHRFWHRPANELGLPLLGHLYEDGVEATGAELAQLASELSVLESHWHELNLDMEPPLDYSITHADGRTENGTITIRAHLHERAAYLKEAIQIARAQGGVLDIG